MSYITASWLHIFSKYLGSELKKCNEYIDSSITNKKDIFSSFFNSRIETTKLIIVNHHPFLDVNPPFLSTKFLKRLSEIINIDFQNANVSSYISQQGVIFLNLCPVLDKTGNPDMRWSDFTEKLLLVVNKLNPTTQILLCGREVCDTLEHKIKCLSWPDIDSPTDVFEKIEENIRNYNLSPIKWDLKHFSHIAPPIIVSISTYERFFSLYFPGEWNNYIQKKGVLNGIIYDRAYKGIYGLTDIVIPYTKKRAELMALILCINVCRMANGHPIIILTESDYLINIMQKIQNDRRVHSVNNSDLLLLLLNLLDSLVITQSSEFIGKDYNSFERGKVIMKKCDIRSMDEMPSYTKNRYMKNSVEYREMFIMSYARSAVLFNKKSAESMMTTENNKE